MAQTVKICLQCQRPRFDPWSGRSPGEGNGLPTPVFFPGEFHGQKSLVGYSSWSCRIRHDWVTSSHSLYLTVCDPMDCTGFSVRGILQARILEWVSHSLLQGTFPTQGWNPGLLHCRQILFASLKNGDNGINLIGLLWWLNDKHRSRAQHSAQHTEWMPSHLSNSNNYHNYHHYCYYHHQGL